MTDPESEDLDAESPPAPSRNLTRPLAVLCAVFFVGAVAMAVLAASLSSDLDDERGGRRDAQRVAASFAERLLTFDHREIDDLRRSVFELSTARFHKEYDRAFPGLKELITAGETVSRGTVTDLFTTDVEERTVSVIAVVSTTTTGRAGRRSADFFMRLDLEKTGKGWLVDGFTDLNFGQSAARVAGGAAPPTTAGG